MRRHHEIPRHRFKELVADEGLVWSESDRGPYWTEDASYSFSLAEIEAIERATLELQARCLDAVQHVIDRRLWSRFEISVETALAIERAWEVEPPAMYGRFDLAYGPNGEITLLEYNADTPTALVEAAVCQWTWMQQVRPGRDQFNSLHDKLIAKWRDLQPYVSSPLYFTTLHDEPHEDWITLAYLQETAVQAGLKTQMIPIDRIGLREGRFVDEDEQPIDSIFKLYPWEWLIQEPFGSHALIGTTQWIEPIWKMVLSNKAILAVLWELFPDHPNLLPTFESRPESLTSFVQKPRLSREGANVRVVQDGNVIAETDGDYRGATIVQALAPMAELDGRRPVLGSWLIDRKPAGIGIREADGWVTDNRSRFIPHWISSRP